MLDILLDSIIDTLKLIPFLYMAFLILEYLEHKTSNKIEKVLVKNKKYGPVFGSVLGSIPQCGFSVFATNLFTSRVITIGTLIAIYLSTSDEMIPILLTGGFSLLKILKIVGIKIIIGIIFGLLIDFIYKKTINKKDRLNIKELCNDENCHCDKENIFKSSLIHTIKIIIFIFIVNLVLSATINYIGEDFIAKILKNNNWYSYFISSLVGLIPNCASSVIITKLYSINIISFGNMLSGLLTGSGIAILLLFKNNHNIRENIMIIALIYIIGVLCGYIIDLVGFIL